MRTRERFAPVYASESGAGGVSLSRLALMLALPLVPPCPTPAHAAHALCLPPYNAAM